jgi:hypothetical protein
VTEQLIVITGAGASYDSTGIEPRDLNWQPPLVKELFAERAAFHPILDFYPDAQTLAPDLRVATRTGSVGLETYLRDQVLRSPAAYDRRRYRAIPLYLQHLLHEVSEHYTTHPVNYDRLINGVLRSANEVIFLTLNYDTILDSRLEQHAHVRSLSDYIRPDFAWSLIKLHGSVDWARRIVGVDHAAVDKSDLYLSEFVASLDDVPELSDEIELRRTSVELLRRDPPHLYYPAISVPLGPDDEFNCPESHLDFIRTRLGATDGSASRSDTAARLAPQLRQLRQLDPLALRRQPRGGVGPRGRDSNLDSLLGRRSPRHGVRRYLRVVRAEWRPGGVPDDSRLALGQRSHTS